MAAMRHDAASSVPAMVLVVAATERELEFVRGAETLCCGIGPVEAALQTAKALVERRPDALLHIGIAGGRGIEAASLVLGSEAVYCDLIDAGFTLPRIERVDPGRTAARGGPRSAAARARPPDRDLRPRRGVQRL